MGNILDELLPESKVDKIVEGCRYHGQRFMSEDGICLKCEDIEGDIYG